MSDEMVIRHCSPTLAGLKTGNIFSCSCASIEQLYKNIRILNKKLAGKGLRILPLRIADDRALIYVYRPKKLKGDLLDNNAVEILSKNGYSCEFPSKCILHLISRLKENDEFPHEIGLFLGYPPEDVCGFIENKAKDCKCVGHWKVYGDAQKAEKTFAKYKKCTNAYMRQFEKGRTIERLTVAV